MLMAYRTENWPLSMIDTLRKGDPIDGCKARLKMALLSVLAIGVKLLVIREVPRIPFYAQLVRQNPIVRIIRLRR